jgi:hypothetical protein
MFSLNESQSDASKNKQRSIMTRTYIYVVARICNDNASFRAKDHSPKSIAQYIQDTNLLEELFHHNRAMSTIIVLFFIYLFLLVYQQNLSWKTKNGI